MQISCKNNLRVCKKNWRYKTKSIAHNALENALLTQKEHVPKSRGKLNL